MTQHVNANTRKRRHYMLLGIVAVVSIALAFGISSKRRTVDPAIQAPRVAEAPDTDRSLLSDAEREYLERLGPVYFCCDPDWEPYEKLDADGQYVGIAADLVRLIAKRSGVDLRLVPTPDWDASLAASRRGDCLVLAFLTSTPEREGWLLFTEPYFKDPTVIIAREEHEYISDLARLGVATVALPRGTGVEERISRRYPQLAILLTDNERSAMDAVSERRADLTLRSLTMAAYTIRKQGYFNLKIVGQLSDFDDGFRMGVSKDHALLRDMLNRGIRTITPQDVQQAVNDHIAITAQTAFDKRLFEGIVILVTILGAATLLWYRYLQRYNSHLRLIIDSMPAYVFAKDSRCRYILANNSMAAFYGLKPKDLLGRTDSDLQNDSERIRDYDAQDREVMASKTTLFIAKHPGQRFDKSPGWFQTTKIPYRRPGTKEMAVLGVTVDITDLKNAEAELEKSEQRYRHLAQHDQLTGLPNRTLFYDLLDQALALCRRKHTGLALIYIDLDHFKEVNDSLGHGAGDRLLREAAARMRACVRASDSVGRIGGDEFCAFLWEIEGDLTAELGAEKIRVALEATFVLEGHEARVSASMGIALFPGHGADGATLARRADAAMYRSKATGRNRYTIYDPAIDGQAATE